MIKRPVETWRLALILCVISLLILFFFDTLFNIDLHLYFASAFFGMGIWAFISEWNNKVKPKKEVKK